MKRQFLLLIITFLVSTISFAQLSLKKRAEKRYNRQEYAIAIGLYEKIVLKNDTDATAVSRLADCYRQVKNYEKAEKWYAKAVQLKNIAPENYFYYAQVLQNNDKHDEAKKWIEKYNSIGKNDTRVQKLLASGDYLLQIFNDSSKYSINTLPINCSKSDFSPAYYKNQLVFVSARKDGENYKWNEEPFLDLYSAYTDSIFTGGKVNLFSKELTSDFHEGPMTFTADFNTVYFTRNFYLIRSNEKNRVNRLKILKSNYDGSKWTNLEEMPFNNIEYSVGHPTLTADGNTMYFVSDMPGGFGGTDIYIVENNGGTWSKPQNAGNTINTEGNEMFPFIHSDGTLFFSSDGHPGVGGLDIFMTMKQNNEFTQPKNLGFKLNSSKDDFGFILDNSKFNGYFTSNRETNKGDDLYKVQITPIKPIAYQDSISIMNDVASVSILPMTNDKKGDCPIINISEYTQNTNNGATVYLDAKTNTLNYIPKKGFVGVDTVYYSICDTFTTVKGCSNSFIVVNVKDAFYGVETLVVMKGTNEPVEGVKVVLMTVMGKVLYSGVTDNTGMQAIRLEKNTMYVLHFEKENYISKNVEITTVGRPEGVMRVKEVIEIEKIQIGLKFAVKIHFDLGKWNIRKDAQEILDQQVLTFLNANPNVTIELSAHTDARGSAVSNENLSQKRAESSVKYLISKGIASNRITAKGYGESQLLNKCADGVKCTEKEHQENRRVEIKVTGFINN